MGGADVSGNDTRSLDRSLVGSERRAIAPSVERAWSREPTDTGDAGSIGEIAHHIQRQSHLSNRVDCQVLGGGLQHVAATRRLFADPLAMLERVDRVGRIIGEHFEHDHAGGAVDRGVVRLLQQRPATVGQALDDVRLPQRARTIHFAADDTSDLLGELVEPRRAGRDRCDVRGKSMSKSASSIQ